MIKDYVFLVGVAMAGGLVNYLGALRNSPDGFRFTALVIELITSGFSGFLVACVAAEWGMSWELTAVAVGIAGHAGGRAIFVLRRMVFNSIKGQ